MEYWRFIREKVGHSRVIIPGVDVAILHGNQLLLVKTKDNNEWFLPGGLQELHESIFETGEREVFEELGLRVKASNLISVYSGPKWIRRYSNGDELQSLTFLIKACIDNSTELSIKIDNTEMLEYGWHALDELPDRMHDYSEMMVRDIREFDGKTIMR